MKYFSTSSIDRHLDTWALSSNTIAGQLCKTHDLTTIKAGEICLLGLHPPTADRIRSKLFGMGEIAHPIHDLGDYIGNDLSVVRNVLSAIYDQGGIVVIMSDQRADGLFHHILSEDDDIKNTVIIGRASEDVYRLYEHKRFTYMCHQAHRAKPLNSYKSKGLHIVRLGQFRSNPLDAEPFFRGAQMCTFGCQAVRYSDAPASPLPSPSGLTSEESCLIANYAGQALNLKLFWIHDFIEERDQHRVHADLMAQIMWYFIEGVSERLDLSPLDLSNMASYVVAFDSLDVPLHFYRSKLTNRWWVLDSYEDSAKAIPCSQKDFEMAKQGDLTARLMQLFDVYA